jgi:tetratricopeptide (TPR) repeat protein
MPLPEASTSRPGIQGRWSLLLSGLLLVSIAAMAFYVVELRTADSEISARLRSLFTQSQPKSHQPVSASASSSEKAVAHALYLKGRYEWNQRTPDSLNRALDYFTQSIVHDPGDARTYVGLADTYLLLREYSNLPENEAYARAIAAAKKAIELDDSLAEAHRALAFAETNGNWDFVTGEKEYRRAVQLDPKDPLARLWHANSFASPGWLHESLAEIDRAQELDPSSHAILADKGLLLFKAGKKQEAIELLKQVERTDPEFRSPHFYLMLISFWIRDYPNYLMEGEKTAQAVSDPVLKDTLAKARAGYTRDGESGLLQNLYAAQSKYYSAGKVPGMSLARTCLRMRRKEEALQLMEEEYTHHSAAFIWCLSDPDFLSLKDDPRYKELLRKMNYPEAPEDVPPNTLAGVANPRASSEPH